MTLSSSASVSSRGLVGVDDHAVVLVGVVGTASTGSRTRPRRGGGPTRRPCRSRPARRADIVAGRLEVDLRALLVEQVVEDRPQARVLRELRHVQADQLAADDEVVGARDLRQGCGCARRASRETIVNCSPRCDSMSRRWSRVTRVCASARCSSRGRRTTSPRRGRSPRRWPRRARSRSVVSAWRKSSSRPSASGRRRDWVRHTGPSAMTSELNRRDVAVELDQQAGACGVPAQHERRARAGRTVPRKTIKCSSLGASGGSSRLIGVVVLRRRR